MAPHTMNRRHSSAASPRARLAVHVLRSTFYVLAALTCTLRAAELDPAAAAPKLDALLHSFISDNGPGAAVLVIHDGKKIYEKGFGLANIAEKTPITPQTNFELASDSKQFTAMAIMMLVEEGKLRYSDKLGALLPEFHKAAHAITVEQLLHHTGGLKDYFEVFDKRGKGAITSRHVMQTLAKETELKFEPGDQYDYSNSGYMVLAQIVEKVSGQRFPEFLKAHIFEPLGMDSTVVYDESHPKIKHYAECYKQTKDGGFKKMEHDDWDNVYGDGSVRSTVEDLFKWDQALYTEKLIKQATLEKAFTSGKTNDGKATDYGYGWSIDKFQRAKVLYHEGNWLGYNNFIYRIPERKFSIIFLSNCTAYEKRVDNLMDRIAKLYYPTKE